MTLRSAASFLVAKQKPNGLLPRKVVTKESARDLRSGLWKTKQTNKQTKRGGGEKKKKEEGKFCGRRKHGRDGAVGGGRGGEGGRRAT